MLCLIAQSCLTLCHPMDCSPPGFSVHGGSPGKNTGMGCQALLQGIFPTQGLNRSPTLYVDSSLSEPPRKPKNTGVGSLSLLQGIFLTQESNWGLLHWRQIFFSFTSWATREAQSKPHWPLTPKVLGTHLSTAESLGWGADVEVGLLTPWGESCHCYYPPVCGSPT